MQHTNKSKALNNKSPIFDLKVPEKDKYKEDGQWFKDYINFILPYESTTVDDYKEMKLAYDIVNNDIRGFRQELENFCNPLGEDAAAGLPNYKPEDILPYNKLHNKVNTYVGEVLNRKDYDHKIISISEEANKKKNKEYREAVQKSVEAEVMLLAEKMQLQQQGLSEREIEEQINQLRAELIPEDIFSKDFMATWESFYSFALRYVFYNGDIQNKKALATKHAVISDRMFLYVGWEYGEPVIKVINPLHSGWHKSPDIARVEKGDYFWNKRPVTIADVYNKYGNQLTEDQIDRLGVYNYASNAKIDRRHSIREGAKKVFQTTTQELVRGSQDIDDKTVGQAQGSGMDRQYFSDRLIWETHIEFKAFREVIFLTYTDQYGQEITDIVPSEYEIPEFAEKVNYINKFGDKSHRWEWVDELGDSFYAEKLWIPRRYEITRLGADIYLNYREVPDQPLYIENPYRDFELSYKGRVLTNTNAKSISPVQRAIPSQMQLFFVKHLINRELGKYRGAVTDIDVDQIPDYLTQNTFGEEIPGRDKFAIWSIYLKRHGFNLYSGTQSAGGLPTPQRSPGSRSALTGTAVDLINLTRLAELIDVEIGMQMGISPQREAQFTQGTNASDNQRAIAQSYNLTEFYFFMMSEVWRHSLTDWLRLFRRYVEKKFEENLRRNKITLEYILPNGTKELFDITRDMLDLIDIVLFVGDSGQDQEYRNYMSQYAQAFAQNPEGMSAVSALLKGITSGMSPEEIHKSILIEEEKINKRMQEAQQQQNEALREKAQREQEIREDQQDHEIQKTLLEIQGKLAEVKAKMDGEVTDQDGINNALENAAKIQDMRIKEREQARKEAETASKAAQT